VVLGGSGSAGVGIELGMAVANMGSTAAYDAPRCEFARSDRVNAAVAASSALTVVNAFPLHLACKASSAEDRPTTASRAAC